MYSSRGLDCYNYPQVLRCPLHNVMRNTKNSHTVSILCKQICSHVPTKKQLKYQPEQPLCTNFSFKLILQATCRLCSLL